MSELEYPGGRGLGRRHFSIPRGLDADPDWTVRARLLGIIQGDSHRSNFDFSLWPAAHLRFWPSMSLKQAVMAVNINVCYADRNITCLNTSFIYWIFVYLSKPSCLCGLGGSYSEWYVIIIPGTVTKLQRKPLENYWMLTSVLFDFFLHKWPWQFRLMFFRALASKRVYSWISFVSNLVDDLFNVSKNQILDIFCQNELKNL